jgi:hypothetical protein
MDRGLGPGDRGVCGALDLLHDSCTRIHALRLLLGPMPALVAEVTLSCDSFILGSFMPFWRDVDSTIGTYIDCIVQSLRLDDVLVESCRFSQERK